MYEHQIIHTLIISSLDPLYVCVGGEYFFRLQASCINLFISQPEIDRRETVRTQMNARLTGFSTDKLNPPDRLLVTPPG